MCERCVLPVYSEQLALFQSLRCVLPADGARTKNRIPSHISVLVSSGADRCVARRPTAVQWLALLHNSEEEPRFEARLRLFLCRVRGGFPVGFLRPSKDMQIRGIVDT